MAAIALFIIFFITLNFKWFNILFLDFNGKGKAFTLGIEMKSPIP